MPRELHLSSLVVHTRPEALPAVARALETLGCEVHLASPEGRLVVTLEAEDGRDLAETVTQLQTLPGVLAANMVFHHSEPAEEAAANEEMKPVTEEPP